MNKCILMGRLTAAPALQSTPSGATVGKFSIAVSRRFAKDGQQQADFINCVVWNKTADFVGKWFSKGSMIMVEGEIQSNSWKDKDGNTRYGTYVNVGNVEFTGEKAAAKSQSEAEGVQQMPNYDEPQQFTEISSNEDDLPF